VLAPRINACGRMGHAREAAELLLTEDAARAEEIARSLTKLNDERRATEQRIVREAVSMAQEEGLDDPSVKAVVLAHREWHPGVIGIVCSRIVDKWHKPTVLLQMGEQECAGSGRSIEGFSLSSALAECDDWLESHGGHDMAAGLRLKTAEYGSFRDAFMTLADERLDSADLVPQLGIDCEARLHELTLSTGRGLAAFAPYGRGNEKPVVLLRDVRLTREPTMMGKGNNHLSLHVTSGENVGAMRLVGWRWGEHASVFFAGQTLDIVCEPSLNSWRGKETMEGVIRDVRVHDPAEMRGNVTWTSSIPSRR
jgi:single-stranded-DNA-specific exonuclease